MQAFEYSSPTSLKEAVALLGSNWDDAQILAGGTDQISLMKEHIHNPKRVVNIKGIKELGGISKTAQGLRIGATATIQDLLDNAAVRSEYPSLMAAARGITSPQIRNMGTVGGDLLQRPRCWYFRRGFGLLAMKDGKSLVPAGQNEYHAILGTNGPAYFVSASSFGPALIALGARAKLVSASGEREVPLEKFFVVPQNGTARETAALPNEILTEIVVPAAQGARNATYELRNRDALDWPLATASVVLRMSGNNVSEARVVLGHVAPTPYVAPGAAQALAGKAVSEQTAEAAGAAAVAQAKPLSDNEYKIQLAKVAVKRAILEAAGKGA